MKREIKRMFVAFVVSQDISFEATQHTNTLLASSTIEEQVHYTMSTSLNKGTQNYPGRSTRPPNRPCFFCGSKQQHFRNICPASGQTCNYCRKRLPTGGERPPQLETHLAKAYSTGPQARAHSSRLIRKKAPTLLLRKAYNMRAASPSQTSNQALIPTPLHWHHRPPPLTKAISFY